jgi:hypothetical protein
MEEIATGKGLISEDFGDEFVGESLRRVLVG